MDAKAFVGKLLEDDYWGPGNQQHKFHGTLTDQAANGYERVARESIATYDAGLGATEWFVDYVEELEDGTTLASFTDEMGKKKLSALFKTEWNGPTQPVPVEVIEVNPRVSPSVKSQPLWTEED